MKWLKNKLRNWLDIHENTQDIIILQEELCYLRNLIKDCTKYNLDIHQYKGSQVIVIGKYRNADFVHCYTIDDQEFKNLINHCIELEGYSHRNKIDAWPTFKATINNELGKIGY